MGGALERDKASGFIYTTVRSHTPELSSGESGMLVDVPPQNSGFPFLSSRRIVRLGVQSAAAKCPLPNEAGPFHTNLPWTLLVVAPTNHRGCEPPDALSQHSAVGSSTKDRD